MIARPPAAVTASAISAESVATITGPTAASSARRITRTIIGSPPISTSGLPGRRADAMRAGMRIRTSDGPIGRGFVSQFRRRLYGLPARRQTGYLSAPPGAALAPIPPEILSFERPSRDGLLRNQQDPGRVAVYLPVPPIAQHRGRGGISPGQARQARLRGCGDGARGRRPR